MLVGECSSLARHLQLLSIVFGSLQCTDELVLAYSPSYSHRAYDDARHARGWVATIRLGHRSHPFLDPDVSMNLERFTRSDGKCAGQTASCDISSRSSLPKGGSTISLAERIRHDRRATPRERPVRRAWEKRQTLARHQRAQPGPTRERRPRSCTKWSARTGRLSAGEPRQWLATDGVGKRDTSLDSAGSARKGVGAALASWPLKFGQSRRKELQRLLDVADRQEKHWGDNLTIAEIDERLVLLRDIRTL